MIIPSDKTGIEINRQAGDRQDVKSTSDKAAVARTDDQELREACQQFEEIFLRMTLKEAHIDRSLFSQKEAGSQLYSDLTRETMAKALAQAGGFGLAEVLYEQLNREDTSTVEPDSTSVLPFKDP